MRGADLVSAALHMTAVPQAELSRMIGEGCFVSLLSFEPSDCPEPPFCRLGRSLRTELRCAKQRVLHGSNCRRALAEQLRGRTLGSSIQNDSCISATSLTLSCLIAKSARETYERCRQKWRFNSTGATNTLITLIFRMSRRPVAVTGTKPYHTAQTIVSRQVVCSVMTSIALDAGIEL